jgi:hypothetical protein
MEAVVAEIKKYNLTEEQEKKEILWCNLLVA